MASHRFLTSEPLRLHHYFHEAIYLLKQRPQIAMDVGLPHLNRQAFVERRTVEHGRRYKK